MVQVGVLPSGGIEVMPKWAASSIQKDGWQLIEFGADNTSLMYEKSAVTPAGSAYRRIWIRYEFEHDKFSGPNKYRSTVDLQEVDCQQARESTLQETLYPQNNLTGDPVSVLTPSAPDWDYGTPGTFGETMIRVACNNPPRRSPSRREP